MIYGGLQAKGECLRSLGGGIKHYGSPLLRSSKSMVANSGQNAPKLSWYHVHTARQETRHEAIRDGDQKRKQRQ
jgi:hypothetical protein